MSLKMRWIAIAAAVICGFAASQNLVAASCPGALIAYTTAGQFGSTPASGKDLLQLAGEPFELTVYACNTMTPTKTGPSYAVYSPVGMTGIVQSGILGYPTKIRGYAGLILAAATGSPDAIEIIAPVEIEPGVTINIQGVLTIPAGTLNSTSIAPFSKVSMVTGKSVLSYSASGNSSTLYVGGVVGAAAYTGAAANASPRLLADAAHVITVHADGTQTVRPMHAAPVDAGASSDTVLLQFYASGVRDASEVQVRIAGQEVPVRYSGAASHFAGLDEVTVEVPRSLAGLGDVDVVLTADGQTANPVRIHIQ
jgi:uncharacterized protein (TIGR03437 family)